MNMHCFSPQKRFLAFGGTVGDFSSHILNAKGTSPCALHAWGNQLTACPCGCRHCGLSHKRLTEKGLFGLLVYSAVTEECKSQIRHIHPCEAMALNGMDPTLDFGNDPRLILSAVGQLASPIHVHWVMSSLALHLHEMRFGKPCFDIETQLQSYLSWLLMRCQLVWPSAETTLPEKIEPLVACWKSVDQLSLGELMFPQRWSEHIDGPITIAAVLDFLFRTQPALLPVCGIEDDHDVNMHEPETPWLEHTLQSNDPKNIEGIDVKFCTVLIDGETSAPIQLSPHAGTTLNDLLRAHQQLVGSLRIDQCVDAEGNVLPMNHPLEVGQVIFVLTSPGNQAKLDCDQGQNTVALTPQPTIVDVDVSHQPRSGLIRSKTRY